MAGVKGRSGGRRPGAGRPTEKVQTARRLEVYISLAMYDRLVAASKKLAEVTDSEYDSESPRFYAATLLERAIQAEANELGV